MNDALTNHLQWYLFQNIFISLSAEFLQGCTIFLPLLKVLDDSC